MHRAYQWVAERTGSLDAVMEEYRARAQAQPDSATAQYLYARLKTGREGSAAIEQLAQRYPQEPLILRSAIYNRWRSGDWRGTLQAWESLRSLNPLEAVRLSEAEATALVALGRRGEALDQLKQMFASSDPAQRAELAGLYARVAHDQKGAVPDELIAALEAEKASEPDSKLWGLRAYAGLPMEGAPDWPSLHLMASVGHDPKAALAHAVELRIEEFQAVSDEGWALAYGEAVRTQATDSETVLARAFLLDAASLDVFRRFVRGEAVSIEEAELEPPVRAAARFVRSRNPSLRAEERRQLLEQARQDDWFHGAVSEAMASWAP
jgi:tetratricopeptide (TPR) repeat protein